MESKGGKSKTLYNNPDRYARTSKGVAVAEIRRKKRPKDRNEIMYVSTLTTEDPNISTIQVRHLLIARESHSKEDIDGEIEDYIAYNEYNQSRGYLRPGVLPRVKPSSVLRKQMDSSDESSDYDGGRCNEHPVLALAIEEVLLIKIIELETADAEKHERVAPMPPASSPGTAKLDGRMGPPSIVIEPSFLNRQEQIGNFRKESFHAPHGRPRSHRSEQNHSNASSVSSGKPGDELYEPRGRSRTSRMEEFRPYPTSQNERPLIFQPGSDRLQPENIPSYAEPRHQTTTEERSRLSQIRNEQVRGQSPAAAGAAPDPAPPLPQHLRATDKGDAISSTGSSHNLSQTMTGRAAGINSSAAPSTTSRAPGIYTKTSSIASGVLNTAPIPELPISLRFLKITDDQHIDLNATQSRASSVTAKQGPGRPASTAHNVASSLSRVSSASKKLPGAVPSSFHTAFNHGPPLSLENLNALNKDYVGLNTNPSYRASPVIPKNAPSRIESVTSLGGTSSLSRDSGISSRPSNIMSSSSHIRSSREPPPPPKPPRTMDNDDNASGIRSSLSSTASKVPSRSEITARGMAPSVSGVPEVSARLPSNAPSASHTRISHTPPPFPRPPSIIDKKHSTSGAGSTHSSLISRALSGNGCTARSVTMSGPRISARSLSNAPSSLHAKSSYTPRPSPPTSSAHSRKNVERQPSSVRLSRSRSRDSGKLFSIHHTPRSSALGHATATRSGGRSSRKRDLSVAPSDSISCVGARPPRKKSKSRATARGKSKR